MKIAKTAASSAALALIFSLAAPALAQDGGQTPEAPQYGATEETGGASDGEAETSGTEVEPNRADDTGPTTTGQDAADSEAAQTGAAQTGATGNGATGNGGSQNGTGGSGEAPQTPNLTTEETEGGGSVERMPQRAAKPTRAAPRRRRASGRSPTPGWRRPTAGRPSTAT